MVGESFGGKWAVGGLSQGAEQSGLRSAQLLGLSFILSDSVTIYMSEVKHLLRDFSELHPWDVVCF